LRGFADRTIGQLPPPAIVILLEAPVETLLERIAARGRGYELAIDRDYLEVLNRARSTYFRNWQRSPVLLVDSVALDLRQTSEAQLIVDTIIEYLPSLRLNSEPR
jgi:deoxyadenosine/deoxycytidine kinase